MTPPATGYNITNLFWFGMKSGDVIKVYFGASVFYQETFSADAFGSMLMIYHSGNALKFEVVTGATVATRTFSLVSTSFINTP